MIAETYPAVPLTQAINGLGVNLGSQVNQEWAYAEAKAAGCTEVRFQIAWSNFESFSTGLYDFTSFDIAMKLCAKYGLRPIVVAAYAPPHSTIKTITVQGLHPIGSTTITTSTNITDLQPGRDHIGGLWYQIGFGKPAYYGGIIHAINGQVIELGAATIGAFADGAQVSINRLLYPSVDQLTGSLGARKYADYVQAMAERMEHHRIAGRIEIWNEPPWVNDRWDQRSGFYDDPASKGIPVWTYQLEPLIKELATRRLPSSVGLVSGATHKSGGHGILRYLTAAQVAESNFVADAIHPYAAGPDVTWWWTTGAGTSWGAGYVNLVGSANFAFNKKVIDENPTAGMEYVISEYGSGLGTSPHRRSYELRHLVSAWAMGIRMVNFYSLSDTAGFEMVDAVTKVPSDAWTDIKRLMSTLKTVKAEEAKYALPVISSWEGTQWNLAVCTIGPVMVVYQRIVESGGGPFYPGPARLVLSPGAGTLRVLGMNDLGHQDVSGNTVYVGSKPVLISRYTG